MYCLAFETGDTLHPSPVAAPAGTALQPFVTSTYRLLDGFERATGIDADRILVAAVLQGAPGAFETLVRAHERLCWHIINRMVRHPDDTRELCQDTFLRVHRYLHQYRFESALKSWIGQVAYSVARRHLERKRIPLAEPASDDDPLAAVAQVADGFDLEAASADAELGAVLHAEIEALPPLQRTLLTLYHLDEVPIPEIARSRVSRPAPSRATCFAAARVCVAGCRCE